MNNFKKLTLNEVAQQKSVEKFTKASFLSIMNCISCVSTLIFCYLIWKKIEQIEIGEISLKTETEIIVTATTVV